MVVVVSGTVRTSDPTDPAEFSGENLVIDFENPFFDEFEDDPIIVADSIDSVVATE